MKFVIQLHIIASRHRLLQLLLINEKRDGKLIGIVIKMIIKQLNPLLFVSLKNSDKISYFCYRMKSSSIHPSISKSM